MNFSAFSIPRSQVKLGGKVKVAGAGPAPDRRWDSGGYQLHAKNEINRIPFG